MSECSEGLPALPSDGEVLTAKPERTHDRIAA